MFYTYHFGYKNWMFRFLGYNWCIHFCTWKQQLHKIFLWIQNLLSNVFFWKLCLHTVVSFGVYTIKVVLVVICFFFHINFLRSFTLSDHTGRHLLSKIFLCRVMFRGCRQRFFLGTILGMALCSTNMVETWMFKMELTARKNILSGPKTSTHKEIWGSRLVEILALSQQLWQFFCTLSWEWWKISRSTELGC